MEITEKQAGTGWTVLVLSGALDARTAPELEAACRARVEAGARRLAVDLAAVSYLSSAGLRALLLVLKLIGKQGGEITLVGPTGVAREVLEVAGFLQLFKVVADATQLA